MTPREPWFGCEIRPMRLKSAGCATTFALFEVLAAYGVFSIWLGSDPRGELYSSPACLSPPWS